MRVTILYLAAGNSRRFGENKLLYPLDGKAVYRHLLDRLAQIAGRHENWELLVVTQYERILEELAPLVKAGRLQTVFSPDSEKGISYTIRAGIEAAEKQNADACACFVADQPYLKEETAETTYLLFSPLMTVIGISWPDFMDSASSSIFSITVLT